MMASDFVLDDHLFCVDEGDLLPKQAQRIQRLLRREMAEIFYGRNLARNLEF